MNKDSLPSPHILDWISLSLFTLFITAQPFYLQHEIIMMDTGIHLPALNALLRGLIPYKDFIFWRGPLELYIPGIMMKIFGAQTFLLPTFFIIGSVLTLIVAAFLAFQIYRTRLMFYLFIPVLVARTFPRVSYYYWGGLRYFIGLLALVCALQAFKKRRPGFFLAAGVISALSLLTTIEAGSAAILAIGAGIVVSGVFKIENRSFILRCLGNYFLSLGLILGIYILYLLKTGSLNAYLDITLGVPKTLIVLMDTRGNYPGNFWSFIYALIPGTKFFKFMTPFYGHLIIWGYLVYRLRKGNLNWEIPVLAMISIYGLILFFASFRAIEGHHFEMALQPEKILLFFLFERGYLFVKNNLNWKVYALRLLIMVFILSSLGYAFGRYNHRFTALKLLRYSLFHQDKKIDELKPLYGEPVKELTIDRLKFMTVPLWQAEEIEGVVKFIQEHTIPTEPIFCYPEVGNFAFWADRPLVGRFSVGTFAWVQDKWQRELVEDFKKARPKYVIMTHVGHKTFPAAIYFRWPENIRKFKEVTELILNNYTPVKSFESVAIYERKI